MSSASHTPLALEEHLEYTLPSGVVVHNWPPPHQPKANLLFQHGFGDYSERWIRDYPFFLRELHARQIHVWAMDIWGHGSSPGKRSIAHIARTIEDHIAVRTRIAGHGELPVILCGHSLGGLVTAGSVSKIDSNVAGVILLAPALPEPITPILRSLIRAVARLIPDWQIFLRPAEVHTLTRNTSFIEKWQADDTVFHGQISYVLASSALDVSASIWPQLDRWTTSVLVVHGDMDTYTNCAQSRAFVSKVKAETKEFYLVKQGRHDLLSDEDAESTWKHVLEWIDGRIDMIS